MFYERVLTLCKQKGISLSKLIVEIGLSKSNATYWKNGATPKSDTVRTIAEYFNVSTDALIGEDLETGTTPANGSRVDSFVSVPIIGRIPAGSPSIAIENIDGFEDLPRSWLNGDPKNHFILKVDGDSMEGAKIYDGDSVLIRKCSTCDNGQICAVGITGETPDLYATLKRVFWLDDEHIELVPENSKYPRRKVKRSEVNIFGFVKKAFRNF